jgi:hypothetical protein
LTMYHRPLGRHRYLPPQSFLVRSEFSGADHADRLVWQFAFVKQDDGTYLVDAEHASPAGHKRSLLAIPRNGRSADVWTFPPAFKPLHPYIEGWERVFIRDVKIPLRGFTPFQGEEEKLRGLGIPAERGANGLVGVKLLGWRLVLPSLALLQALAMPSARVASRLLHPLSLDLVLRRRLTPYLSFELRCTSCAPGNELAFSALDTVCMAFWMTEDRITSLWRAMQTFGQTGWTLSLPDRHEELNLMFDGYAQGDLLVVQRLRVDAIDPLWPFRWHQLAIKNSMGRTLIGHTQFDGQIMTERLY